MTTTTGRFFAVVIMLGAGSFLIALGIASAVYNQLTLREVLLGSAAILVAVVAALWLYRDRRQHGRQP